MKIIHNPYNIFYETGFKASFGLLLLDGNKKILLTDSRYKLKAESLGAEKGFEVKSWSTETFAEALSGKEIEYEADTIKLKQLETWQKLAPKTSWIPMQNGPSLARRYKSEEEIQKMKASQALNEAILEEALGFLKEGLEESNFQRRIKIIALEKGVPDQAFEPIVAFGENSAIPHHESGKRSLKKGDTILIDMGQKVEGYASDMTRCFFWKTCSERQAEIYEKVLAMQEEAIKKMVIGQNIQDLEEELREKLGALASNFSHRLGHGIGLEVHESLGECFEENVVSTVEPGLYFDHEFGVRIEDLGCIRKQGFENFTQFPKKLRIL